MKEVWTISRGHQSNSGRLTASCHLFRFLILQRQAQSYHSVTKTGHPRNHQVTLGTKWKQFTAQIDNFGDLPTLPRLSYHPNVVISHPLAFTAPHLPQLKNTLEMALSFSSWWLFSTPTHTCFHPYLINPHWWKASWSSCCLAQRLN